MIQWRVRQIKCRSRFVNLKVSFESITHREKDYIELKAKIKKTVWHVWFPGKVEELIGNRGDFGFNSSYLRCQTLQYRYKPSTLQLYVFISLKYQPLYGICNQKPLRYKKYCFVMYFFIYQRYVLSFFT